MPTTSPIFIDKTKLSFETATIASSESSEFGLYKRTDSLQSFFNASCDQQGRFLEDFRLSSYNLTNTISLRDYLKEKVVSLSCSALLNLLRNLHLCYNDSVDLPNIVDWSFILDEIFFNIKTQAIDIQPKIEHDQVEPGFGNKESDNYRFINILNQLACKLIIWDTSDTLSALCGPSLCDELDHQLYAPIGFLYKTKNIYTTLLSNPDKKASDEQLSRLFDSLEKFLSTYDNDAACKSSSTSESPKSPVLRLFKSEYISSSPPTKRDSMPKTAADYGLVIDFSRLKTK